MIKYKVNKFIGERNVFHESDQFKKELDRIFEAEIKQILEGTEKFSGDELKKFVQKVVRRAIHNMKRATDQRILDIYRTGLNYVGDITKQAISMEKIDYDAIKAIRETKVLFAAYQNMDDIMVFKTNKIISEAYEEPKEFTIPDIVQKIRDVANLETYRLSRIVRTETQAASMKGREISFNKVDPEGIFLYKWAVKFDNRTSSVCKEIHSRVTEEANSNGKNGISLNRLKEIIKEESFAYNGPKWIYRDFVPHINCRSGLIRVV